MVKRAFDLVAAAVGIVLLSPLLIAIALLVRLDSPGPILFRQVRIGRGGKPFEILKFRTMHTGAEGRGAQLTVGKDPRVTRAGSILRRSKLDELPQLFNVLIGDMSLVGPRPEVPRYVAHYDPVQRQVLQVRPGITDLASVEFRDENELLTGHPDPEAYYLNVIMPRKLELNRQYIERQSFWFDLWIIAMTLWRVVSPAPVARPRQPERMDA